MKTRTPYATPFPDRPSQHKKTGPKPKHSESAERCSKFYCGTVKANVCCSFCRVRGCDERCENNNTICGCLSDEIKGGAGMNQIRRGT